METKLPTQQLSIFPRSIKVHYWTMLLFCCFSYTAAAQITPDTNNILYVDENAPSGGTGNSWANAITELADALKWARQQHAVDSTWLQNDSLQIYIAKGTYQPLYNAEDGNYDQNGNRDNSFVMIKNVQLYGGFDPANGIETLADTRILPASTSGGTGGTLLSGDIGTINDDTDNAYHVVISVGGVGNALLDGLTLTGGNADGGYYVTVNGLLIYGARGGGMYNDTSSPALTNVRITNNSAEAYGGGMFNRENSSPTLTNVSITNNSADFGGGMFNANYSSPTLTNVSIASNSATTSGGGVYNTLNSSPTLTNVRITNNSADFGGGMSNHRNSSPMLTNVSIVNNSATTNGGGMDNRYNSSPTLTNVSITNNSATTSGGGMYNDDNSSPAIHNSIVVDNGQDNIYDNNSTPTYSHSLVDEQTNTANGNIDPTGIALTPIFTDPANGDYSLAPNSPAINTGDNTLYTNAGGDLQNDMDIAGNPRLDAVLIDMGAYEFQGAPIPVIPDTNNILYVDKNVPPGGNGTGDSWANAITELADALKWAREQHDANNTWLQNDSLQIYIAKGTYTPLYNAEDGNYDQNGNRDNSFVMVKNVQLYGGFDPANGIETLADNRILPASTSGGTGGTLLSGDIGTINDDTDNAHHVVLSVGDVGNALLDGLTLTGGNAEGGTTTVAVNGVSIYRAIGGGMFNETSSPTLTNVNITNNSADYGGGMYNKINSSPTLTNVSITNNSAAGWSGGMFNLANSSPTLTNVSITNNSADLGGGGMYNRYNSSPTIHNSIIVGNGADNMNSAASSYPTYSHSLVDEQTNTANGNIDPTGIALTAIFTDPTNGDYSLAPTSPAINTGDNTLYTNAGGDLQNDMDIAGNPRVYDVANAGIIDMGAYETQNNAPVVVCQDIMVQLDENGEVSITAGDIDNGSSDEEGTLSLSIDRTDFDCNDIGDQTVTLTVEDEDGATTTCQATVTIEDNLGPIPDSASLPDITTECEVLESEVTPPTATDNCSGTVTVTNDATFPITSQGTTVITWTYADENGNTSTQTQNVVLDDVTAPVADNATLAAITTECEVLESEVTPPTATDNCSGTVTVTNDATFPITTQGTTVITWTYADENGNTSTQTQNVVLDDVTAPVADNATLAAITAECEVLESEVTPPTATDNCSGTVTVTNDATFPITSQGTTVITWTYADENGNTSTQTQNVVLDDVTAPVADNATLAAITAECEVLESEVTPPIATDNCSGTVTVTHDATFPITSQGTTVITWTYADENGNTSTQTQNVVIDDVTAPVADNATLADVTMECEVSASDVTAPTATDNCGGTVTVTHDVTFPITTQGTTVVTWTYTDENGNISTQTQNINVLASPIAGVTFDDATVTYDGSVHSISVNNLPSDASVNYSISPNTGTPNGATDAGTYTVTAMVTPPASAVNCETITLTATLTINQATQIIDFAALPVVTLEDDPDFQLQATASSGLPVDYTYTYTAANPPATVSSTGWVDLLTSGLVEITAHQPGNANYLPANSVMQPLHINSRDASAHNVRIENELYNNPTGEIYYRIDCNSNAEQVEVSIETETNASVTPAHQFTIQTPVPGIYRQEVVITSQDGSTTKTYEIIVEKQFRFDDILVQKFNNVLLVNNNPQNNGGYHFVSYRWYKNGQFVGSGQYYSAGDKTTDLLKSTDVYSVEMITEQGEVLHTCDFQIELTASSFAVTVYPNPTHNLTTTSVSIDASPKEFERGISLSVYTVNGRLVKSFITHKQLTQLSLSNFSKGVYMIVCKTSKHTKTSKLIIR